MKLVRERCERCGHPITPTRLIAGVCPPCTTWIEVRRPTAIAWRLKHETEGRERQKQTAVIDAYVEELANSDTAR